MVVVGVVETPLGPLAKEVHVLADRVELVYRFSAWGERPLGSLRTGMVTLHPEGFGKELAVTCANGGVPERIPVPADCECDHGRSVSSLVSARSVFGATDGRVLLDDGEVGLELTWPQERTAALPMLTVEHVREKRFARVAFSLAEFDETHRPGAKLRDFRLGLRARRMAA